MVECTSRYVILAKLEVPAAEAAQAIVREMSWMAPSILKTMMLDQGSEMARDAEKHSGNGDEGLFRRSPLTLAPGPAGYCARKFQFRCWWIIFIFRDQQVETIN